MQVGDLVKHRSDGCFGTITQIRINPWDMVEALVMVHWVGSNQEVLHPIGQVEVQNEV
jgi:hypothetical protein